MPAMEYSVTSPDGQQGTMDEAHVASELGKLGYAPQGVSADGLNVTLQDDKGAYSLPISDALGKLGWKVNDAKPMNADYSNVQPEWRAAVSTFQDDDMAKAYLKAKLQKAGQPDATVHGSGRNWYVFNPQTNQWIGVTNEPGSYGLADLAEVGAAAPRLVGSALGGAGGALMGAGTPASIAGAAGGGALGSAAGSALTRGGLSAFDPEYAQVSKQHLGKVVSDVTGDALIDGATGGIFKGAGMLAPEIKAALQTGPLSTLAKGAGKTMAAGGQLAAKGGELLDNPLGRGAVTAMTPGLNTVQTVAGALRAPAFAAKLPAQAAGLAAESGTVQRMAPGLAQKAAAVAKTLGRPIAKTKSFAEQVASLLRGGSEEGGLTAESVLGNTGAAPERIATRNAYRVGRQFGLPSDEAYTIAKQSIEDLPGPMKGAIKGGGKVGAKVGRAMDRADTVGTAIERASEAPAAAAIKLARHGGKVAAKAGQALDQVGTAFQPMENQLYGMYGAEEALRPVKRRLPPWIDADKPDTINAILAQNH